jgi:hypothetical protein
LKGREPEFLNTLRGDPVYQRLFAQAFPGTVNVYTLKSVTKAIAAFEPNHFPEVAIRPIPLGQRLIGDLGTFLKTKLFRTAACDYAFDLTLPDAHDHVRHDVTECDFSYFPFQLISGRNKHDIRMP